MLYLFSGCHRQTSFASNLKRKAAEQGFTIHVREVDISYGKEHDLSVEANMAKVLMELRSGLYDAVIQ